MGAIGPGMLTSGVALLCIALAVTYWIIHWKLSSQMEINATRKDSMRVRAMSSFSEIASSDSKSAHNYARSRLRSLSLVESELGITNSSEYGT